MKVAELVSIALANTDDDRVEVMALESAEFSTVAVSPMAGVISELAGNAVRHGSSDSKVRVAGLWDAGGYLISISDRGPGMTEKELRRYNGLLADFSSSGRYPGGMLGLPIVARLAAQHQLIVQLVPGAPGISAHVQVPKSLVDRLETSQPTEDLEDLDMDQVPEAIDDVFNPYLYPNGDTASPRHPVVSTPNPSEIGDWQAGSSTELHVEAEMETFLESIFAPLLEVSSHQTETWSLEFPDGSDEKLATITKLRVRVPGDHYELADDSPSTASAERAIDIKTALATFDAGRKSAREHRDQNRS